LPAGDPDLEEWTGGGEEEEGESDGRAEGGEDGGEWVAGGAAEIGLGEKDEEEDGEGEQGDVEERSRIPPSPRNGAWSRVRHPGSDGVSVEISEEQGGLEEDEAGDPDGGGAAEGGEQAFGGHGLDGEEQKGAEENGCSVKDAERAGQVHAAQKKLTRLRGTAGAIRLGRCGDLAQARFFDSPPAQLLRQRRAQGAAGSLRMTNQWRNAQERNGSLIRLYP
jgi:hypothetical protein